jgi:Tfp pilus assembly protein PilF
LPVFRATLGHIDARNGKIEQARTILSELIQAAKSDRASWLDVAGIYAGLGEKDHAFAALDLAFQRRDSRLTMLLNIETLEPLHSDPRFADLLRRVGLPDRR